MGLLKKPYEISLWEDVWNNTSKQFEETRTLTIGSSEMEYLGRAIEPNLVRKTNGEVSFSFKMYYQFVDTTTGETVNNPFVDYIANETKVKLKYGDEWFDLLVKNIHKDSATKSYTYQLVDQHMTELSKNGFDVQLDSKLFNNLGTAEELGQKVLQNTDWGVESEKIVQTQDEALVMLKLPDDLSDYAIYQIDDTNLSEEGAKPSTNPVTLPEGGPIYAFYSSCSGDKPYRFQFIYKPFDNEQPTFSTYSDRIIADQNCQYYIDGITEWVESSSFTIPKDFALDTRESSLDGINNNSAISVLYRGRRYVYSQISEYHPGLDMYLQKYRDPEQIEYYKYQKTEYVAPSLIQNVVNNAEFKETSAWKGGKFLEDGDAIIEDKPASSPEFSATVETVSMYDDGNVLADATDVMLGYTAVDDEGANWSSVIGNQNYKPYLRCGNLHKVNNMVKAIVNSGTSDTAAFQQGITEGEQYVFDIKAFLIAKKTNYVFGSSDQVESVRYTSYGRFFPRIVVAKFDYDSSLNGYNIDDYTNLETSEDVLFLGNAGEKPVKLAAKRTVTSEVMQKSKYQIFLLPDNINPPQEGTDFYGKNYRDEYFMLIEKIQFYKLYPKENGGYYTPDDDLNTTEVSYIVEDRYFPVVENDIRTLGKITFVPVTSVFTPVLSANGSKKSAVNVKESNYFNAIQAIASTFECWPQLEVNHDATGKIVNFPYKDYSKRIHFKNYVGQKNHVGFKYGVNSKDIKRTIDSNQIVSKLIVKANSNEYAPNGFCTIARAPANSIKDNVLYNFDYYVSQQMLDATALQNDLHIAGETEGQTPSDDMERLMGALSLITPQNEDWANDVLGSCTGYYPKMRVINQKLETLQKLIAEKNTPLIAETATYNTYKAVHEAAVSDLEEQQDRFFKLAGFAYNDIPGPGDERGDQREVVMNSTTLFSILQTIAELAATEQDAKAKYETAKENMELYSRAILTLENQQKNTLLLKEVLNNMFYTRYSRFIQEGTWIDESYLDESLYYNDALSVSYNSAMPKVTYSMNVLSLAGLPGYELFDFKVGDQTFVEDTEFFGYDTTGAPIRAEVTITQTSENLDDPTKNTIQIRNYENQFEDLFQRINATVQSVQYSEGSYRKAAEFAEADAAHKFSFLNDALSAAEAYIGDTNNTVVVDTSGGTGITITDKNNAEQALRLTSGAILLKGTNPDTGEKVWKTGLTAEGISASLINAGILNTGEINIMNGDEPTFRWDSHGITAYDFDNSTSNTFFGINKMKGVRFDRFGLYGYSGINGETWKPTGINTGTNSIEEHSTFYLTWEGLKIVHENSSVRIGKYSWDETAEDGELVTKTSMIKITKSDEDIFIVDGDGNAGIKGHIVASSGTIAKFNITEDYLDYRTDNTFGKATGLYGGDTSVDSLINFSEGGTPNKSPIRFFAGAPVAHGQTTLTTEFTPFMVLQDGSLYASGAEIIGTITANKGEIGGWTVDEEGLSNGGIGLYVGERYYAPGYDSPIRIASNKLINTKEEIVTLWGGSRKREDVTEIQNHRLKIEDMTGWNETMSDFQIISCLGVFYVAETTNIITTVAGHASRDGDYFEISFVGIPPEECDMSVGVTISYNSNVEQNEQAFYLLADGTACMAKGIIEDSLAFQDQGGTLVKSKHIGWRDFASKTSRTITYTVSRFMESPVEYEPNHVSYFVTISGDNTPLRKHRIKLRYKIGNADKTRWIDWDTNDTLKEIRVDVPANSTTEPTNPKIVAPNGLNSQAAEQITLTQSDEFPGSGGGLVIGGNLVPGFVYREDSNKTPNDYCLGTMELPWNGIHVKKDGIVEVSDLNEKRGLTPIEEKYESFYNSLLPLTYIFKDGNRTHIGFCAQYVRDALLNNNLSTQDFAGYVFKHTQSGEKHNLRYSEFIALNTWQIQKLKPRMTKAEEKIAKLEQEIEELRMELAKLN